MNTSSNSSFEEATSWLELDEVVADVDSRAAATYAYGAAQRLGIAVLLSEENGELMLRSGEILSAAFDLHSTCIRLAFDLHSTSTAIPRLEVSAKP